MVRIKIVIQLLFASLGVCYGEGNILTRRTFYPKFNQVERPDDESGQMVEQNDPNGGYDQPINEELSEEEQRPVDGPDIEETEHKVQVDPMFSREEKPIDGIVIENQELEIAIEDQEPEIVIENQEPEIVIENQEPEIVIENQEPEIVIENQEPEIVIENQEPEIVIENQEPEIVIENQEPEIAFDQRPLSTELTSEEQRPIDGPGGTGGRYGSPPRGDQKGHQIRGPGKNQSKKFNEKHKMFGKRKSKHTKKIWWKKWSQKHGQGHKTHKIVRKNSQNYRIIYDKCRKNHSISHCSLKIKKIKQKFWSKYHKKNWRSNILRWKERSPEWFKHINKIKQDVLSDKFKTPEMIRKRLHNFKLQHKNETKLNSVQQRTQKQLKKQLKQSKKEIRHINDYIVYEDQLQNWKNSPNGKCIRARFFHQVESNPISWSSESSSERSDKEKTVKEACSEVTNKFLPFANGGCFDKLDNIFEETFGCLKDLKTVFNDIGKSIECVKNSILKAADVFENECQNDMFKQQAPTCKEYLEKELNVNDLHLLKNGIGGVMNTLKMGMQWGQISNVMNKLMSEDLWINAPDDCGISLKEKVAPLVKNSAAEKVGEEVIDDLWKIKKQIQKFEGTKRMSDALGSTITILGGLEDSDHPQSHTTI